MLTAWGGGHIGTKLVSIFPGNDAAAELPSVQGVYVLFEARYGEPVLVADGTALTLRKTAADSALGADYLARRDERKLSMRWWAEAITSIPSSPPRWQRSAASP